MKKLLVFVAMTMATLVAASAGAQTVLPRSGWVANASSSNGGDVPSHVLDGSASTRWTTGGNQTPGQWFTVDFGSAQTFTQVTLDVASNTSDYARSYELYVSNDGQTWGSPVASGTGATGIITIVFPSQTSRFIGIVQTGSSSTNWWSIAELNVYTGTVPTTPLVPSGWTASASVSGSSDQPSKAIDGSLSTRFSTDASQVNGQTFQLDMGSAQLITALKMDSDGNTSDYARGYQIFASNSTSNWGSAVATGTGTASPIVVYFPQTTARYVKIVQTGSSSNWWSIAELTMYTVGSSAPAASVLGRNGWSASASSTLSGTAAANVLDDNAATRWSTSVNQANGQSFTVDMQAPRSFTKLTLDTGSSNAGDYPRGYQVFVSADGSTWGSAVATGSGSSQVTTITLPVQVGRYVKVVQTGSSSTNKWSIAELNVYGTPPAVVPRTGWTASASLDNSEALLGIDGKVETQWSTNTAQASGMSYTVDMKVTQSFNEIVLDVECNPADYPRGVQVFVSSNGTTWGSAIASATGTAAIVTVAFTQQSARYLKVVSTASASNYWGIAELNVVNTNPAACSSSCVALDACHDVGTCNPSTGVCSNPAKADGTACPNSTVCDGVETCQAGTCTAGTPPVVNDGNPCTVDACDPVTGVSHTAVANGTACPNSTVCDGAETCQAGTCTAGTPPVVDDGNPCTADACDPVAGVSHTAVANGTACPNSTVCDGAETCQAGTCTAGTPPVVNDGNPCTVDACDPVTGVSHTAVANGTACPNGTVCDGAETCQAGTCTAGTPLVVNDGNPCTADACDPVTGVSHTNVANGTACPNGTVCDGAETCQAGTCTAGTPPVVNDGNPCTVDACDPVTGVSHTNVANGTACPNSTVCDGAETCQSGACTSGTPLVVDDGNPCTADSCDPVTGVHHTDVANGTACPNGTVCDGAETCQSGACTTGTPLVVDDGNPCTADSCDPVTGVHHSNVANGTSCSDGNACTQTDTCQSGTCVGGNPVTCATPDQCHTAGTCDPTNGLCSNPAKANGTTCSDGNACTQTDTCQSGLCTGSNPVTCTASDQCHVAGTCDPTNGLCSNPNATNGTACSDGNGCTQTDRCQSGVCAGSNPVTCAPSDQCHNAGVCDPASGICSNPARPNGAPCSDGNACTTGDTCQTGTCTAGAPVTCAPIDSCHSAGTCDSTTGACSNPVMADGTACSDGNVCTTGDTCHSGVCSPGTVTCHPPHIISTPVTRFARTSGEGELRPFDLRGWTPVQYEFFSQPDAHWVIDSSGTVATQTVNADASALISNVPVDSSHVQGTWVVNTGNDNDFMGFVFGWQDRTHFYLFDWKDGDETGGGGIALNGMTVKVANADSDLHAEDLWPTSGNGTRVRPLYHNNISWSHFQPYDFTLDFQPGHFVITVKQGTTVLDTISIDDSTYTSGEFGFYNSSQDSVQYSGFSHALLSAQTYDYDVVATDADGDPITYSLLTAPSGMTIDPTTGKISWLTQPGAGSYQVSVQARDPGGLTDVQTYTVVVEDNHPPVVDAGPDQQNLGVSFPVTEPLEGSVQDELPLGNPGLTVTWSEVSGPGTVTFADASSPTTTALFTLPGSYVLQLKADDGVATSTDFVTIAVDSQPSLAGANLHLVASNPGPLSDGQSLTLTATLLDSTSHAMPNVAVEFDVAGANAQSAFVATNASGVATYTYVGANVGTDNITATALGGGGAPTATVSAIVWTAATTGPAVLTQGWIGSPLHQAPVMGQVPVTVGSGETLTSGTVTYWPMSAPDQVHTLASGVVGGPGTTIATLDTTVLANGSWVIKLDATDNQGHSQVSEVSVTVSGDYKPGRVVVEVTDMTIPVPGIPVTVGRRYDSLEKDNVGDFGHGWSLTLGHPKLEVDPGHNVTITMPDNRRVTFQFQATSVTASAFFSWLYGPGYVPEAGTYGSLTGDGCPLMVVNAGQIVCFLDSSPVYAPTTYTYTDPYGRVFVMGADGSLKSITDRQQNTLTFTPTGIASNSGVAVTFARDGLGRITSVTSPAVDPGTGPIVYSYEYDANGDLVKVHLPGTTATAQYAYSADNRLLMSKDPNGNLARTSTYDTAGRLATDTDPLGNVTGYAYDLAAHKTTITNPDTGTVQQTFDDRGLLLKEIDPLGRTTEHTYDGNRNELTRKNALGEVTTMTYDANGNQTSIANARGETTTITYNAFSEPLASSDPAGHTTTISYDSSGIPAAFSDEIGVLATFTSSEHGLPLTITDPAGKTTLMTYDEEGDLVSRTDRLGRSTVNGYDGTGRMTSTTDPRGGVTRYSYILRGPRSSIVDATAIAGHDTRTSGYDQNLNLTSETSDEGRFTNYTYDALNHLTKVAHTDGTTIQYTRDFRGNPLTMTDESGRTTSYEYDKAGQLEKTTYPDGTFTTRAYDRLGRLATATDERRNATSYEYETGCGCADRVTKLTDSLGRAIVTAYDAVGRRASVTDAAGHTTAYAYDVRGHLTTTTYADGTTEVDGYDALGRRTIHTDQMGSVTRYGYDAEGQLTSVMDALSHVTQYGYDASGNLTSVTDANGHTTAYAYDHLNRKSQRTLPLGMSETWTYNMYGDNLTHVDFRGKTTAMTYDGLSRQLTKVPDSSLGEPTVTFTYNPTGTRASMADASGSTAYGYDVRDRLLTKATPAGTLTYTYDAAGNVATIRSSNANGTSVDYAWDAANQLASITDNRAGGVTTAAYTATGRPSTLSHPSGVGATYGYDTLDRVTSLAWTRGAGPAFGSWTYGFNDRGQRTSVTDATGRRVAYGYDAVTRLTSEIINNDPQGAVGNGELDYTVGPTGNRLIRTSTLAALGAQSFDYDANDQLSTDGYDANGNTIGSAGHSYSYDFENRLRSKDSGTVTIVYDGDGNRVAKTVAGVTTKYLVDDLNPTGYVQVLEEVQGGVIQTAYTYGAMLVSQVRQPGPSAQTSYYGYDARGNVSFLTDPTGAITDSYDYDSWGKLVASNGSTPNTRFYDGEEFDRDLGLINLRARYYNPDTGRFFSIDPARGRPRDPLSFNRFLYGEADPENRFDPRGFGATGYAVGLGIAAALEATATVVLGAAGTVAEVVTTERAIAVGLAVACAMSVQISAHDQTYSPPFPLGACKVRIVRCYLQHGGFDFCIYKCSDGTFREAAPGPRGCDSEYIDGAGPDPGWPSPPRPPSKPN